MPRCANYCAIKSALHSICWTLRTQLGEDEASGHIRVVEIIPPAVQTELHLQQPDLVEKGLGNIGITIEEFMDDAWSGLTTGKEEIMVGPIKERFGQVEEGRKAAYQHLLEVIRKQEASGK
jgi:short-subunit dehydrogenase involved in D-alanine esterification of teichoic acids